MFKVAGIPQAGMGVGAAETLMTLLLDTGTAQPILGRVAFPASPAASSPNRVTDTTTAAK